MRADPAFASAGIQPFGEGSRMRPRLAGASLDRSARPGARSRRIRPAHLGRPTLRERVHTVNNPIGHQSLLRLRSGPSAIIRAGRRPHGAQARPELREDAGARWTGQSCPTALRTSAAIRSTSAGVSVVMAHEVGHIVPSSSCAWALKPKVE